MIDISFQAAAQATIQIFLMGLVGYVMIKKKLTGKEGLRLLTRLLITWLLPCLIFTQMSRHFNFDQYPYWWIFPLLCFALMICGLILSRLMLFLAPSSDIKREFTALMIFQNCGYIPLLMAAAIFPGEIASRLFVYIFLFIIGFDLLLWSFGVYLIGGHATQRLPIKKMISPPLRTLIISMIIVLFGFNKLIPSVMMKPVDLFGQCALPLAMIVVGGNLACIKVTEVKVKEMVLLLAGKLFLLPILALIVVSWLKPDILIGFLIVIEACVPSALNLSVIARQYEGEQSFVNQAIFYGHLIGIGTIPLFLVLYSHIAKGF